MEVTLRPLRDEDLVQVHGWRNDAEVTRHLAKLQMSLEEVRAWFASLVSANGDRAYAILADGAFVGYAVLSDSDRINRKCEAGMIIGSRAHWGRGIGKAVARKLVECAFREVGMHRVLAVASERNPASVACFRSAGFREEGRLRHANLRDGEFIDLILLSLLETEWEPTVAGWPRGAGVFRDPWWFRCVAAVDLDGITVWEDLTALLRARASGGHAGGDATWFLAQASVALQIPAPKSLALDIVAARVHGGLDLAYPFLVRERSGRVICGFSNRGPAPDVRDSILAAFADRFLWAAT